MMFTSSFFSLSLSLSLNSFCSHSDRNLESLENANNKEEDKAVLLEGGASKSPSAKSRQIGNVKTSLVRLFFLLKGVLRAFKIFFKKLINFVCL